MEDDLTDLYNHDVKTGQDMRKSALLLVIAFPGRFGKTKRSQPVSMICRQMEHEKIKVKKSPAITGHITCF